jgi:hypothetical protein
MPSLSSEASAFQSVYRLTPATISLAGFPLLVPDSPGVDHDEDEEYITLRVMELPRDPGTRRSAESHEDPIGECRI